MRCSVITFSWVCIISCSSLVLASEEDTKQPITIEADQAVLDEEKQISQYTGHVLLKQGGIEVKANSITVYAKDGKLQRVLAEGDPVHFKQQRNNENIRGESLRMEYEANNKRVLLLKNAELWQGKNHFSGERIEYDPSMEKVIATGDADTAEQRVHITIQPKSNEKAKP